MAQRRPSTGVLNPQHTSKTLASATPHHFPNSSDLRREDLAIQPGFRGSDTSTPAWTEPVNVAEGDSIMLLARFYSNSYPGFVPIRRSDPSHQRRTEDSRGGGGGADRSHFARVTICFATLTSGTSGLLSNILVSQISRASLLSWINLPATSLQVPAAQWGTRFSATAKMRLFCQHIGQEARNRWLSRSHVPRTLSTRLSLITDDSPTHLGREILEDNFVGTAASRTWPSALSAHVSSC